MVSRLTAQKGIHLIKHAAHHTVERGGQFVLLGSAPDPRVQGDFDNLKSSIGGSNAGFAFTFDEPLSHLVYAACDIILVPSMFEPCGLTQMIAMRYGAVPVVRATGGLRDTVFDVDNEKGRAAWEILGSTDAEKDGPSCVNGFSFEGTDNNALNYGLDRALDAYYNDKAWFHSLGQRNMRQDWSWNRPVRFPCAPCTMPEPLAPAAPGQRASSVLAARALTRSLNPPRLQALDYIELYYMSLKK